MINENRWPDTIKLDSEHHKRYVPAWADSELRFRQRHISRMADIKEGTFTLRVLGPDTNTTQVGAYTKIGRTIHWTTGYLCEEGE